MEAATPSSSIRPAPAPPADTEMAPGLGGFSVITGDWYLNLRTR